jgi:CRISP-associated protein Cas1
MTRELLNTLFVLTENAVVSLDGEALVVRVEKEKKLSVPLHHLGSVCLFGTAHITGPALARCAKEGRAVNFLDFGGRFQARVEGPESGNILLRLAQFASYTDPLRSAQIARCLVAGKLRNQRQNLLRSARDAKDEGVKARLYGAGDALARLVTSLPAQPDTDAVRGIEGQGAALYFDVFGDMLTVPTTDFAFTTRSRRPPRDRVNAVLSFLYALLTADCTAACEGVGLDPQLGFLHTPRPGRPSLSLDLMEEFRPVLCERLALTLINRRQLRPTHFSDLDGGSVLLNESGRKLVLSAYSERRKEEVDHPFLHDRAPLGLLPHLQARLLARHLRGDLDHYPPFLVG